MRFPKYLFWMHAYLRLPLENERREVIEAWAMEITSAQRGMLQRHRRN